MKILVLAPHLPATSSMPGSPRLFQFCRHLAGRHDLTLIAKPTSPERRALFEAEPEAARVFPRVLHLPPLPPAPWSRRQAHRLRLASNLRTDVRHPEYHRHTAETVRTALRELGDDALVYADCLEMTQYVPPAARRAVVDLHDCLSYLARQRAHVADGRRHKAALWLEQRSLARWERSLAARFQAVILNSEIDAAIYRRLAPGAPTQVIDNGVDTDYWTRSRPPQPRPVLVFTGVLSYGPNEDAVRYFVAEILPRLRRAQPDVRFWIVGASPPPAVQALADLPGVEVFGSVPDIRPYLEAASVFVCPLRYGAGMKNKVLTALAMQLPVVATSTSLANIGVQPGQDVLLADEPEAFARQVTAALEDPTLRSRLGERGRALVVERYSWRERAARMEELMQQIAAGGRRAGATA